MRHQVGHNLRRLPDTRHRVSDVSPGNVSRLNAVRGFSKQPPTMPVPQRTLDKAISVGLYHCDVCRCRHVCREVMSDPIQKSDSEAAPIAACVRARISFSYE